MRQADKRVLGPKLPAIRQTGPRFDKLESTQPGDIDLQPAGS